MQNDVNNEKNINTSENTYNYPAFVSALKKILKGQTQLEFAEKAGINNATLSRILNGKRTNQPYKSTVDKIAGILDEPELIQELYLAAGYTQTIDMQKETSPIAKDDHIHREFFYALVRGLSFMGSSNNIGWKFEKGDPNSNIFLVKLDHAEIDYWYIRYLPQVPKASRQNQLKMLYGELAELNLSGKIKSSFVTPSLEDFNYFISHHPLQLNLIVSFFYFDCTKYYFSKESYLKTNISVSKALPCKDFCIYTKP